MVIACVWYCVVKSICLVTVVTVFFSFFLCCFFILSIVYRWIKDYHKGNFRFLETPHGKIYRNSACVFCWPVTLRLVAYTRESAGWCLYYLNDQLCRWQMIKAFQKQLQVSWASEVAAVCQRRQIVAAFHRHCGQQQKPAFLARRQVMHNYRFTHLKRTQKCAFSHCPASLEGRKAEMGRNTVPTNRGPGQ